MDSRKGSGPTREGMQISRVMQPSAGNTFDDHHVLSKLHHWEAYLIDANGVHTEWLAPLALFHLQRGEGIVITFHVM